MPRPSKNRPRADDDDVDDSVVTNQSIKEEITTPHRNPPNMPPANNRLMMTPGSILDEHELQQSYDQVCVDFTLTHEAVQRLESELATKKAYLKQTEEIMAGLTHLMSPAVHKHKNLVYDDEKRLNSQKVMNWLPSVSDTEPELTFHTLATHHPPKFRERKDKEGSIESDILTSVMSMPIKKTCNTNSKPKKKKDQQMPTKKGASTGLKGCSTTAKDFEGLCEQISEALQEDHLLAPRPKAQPSRNTQLRSQQLDEKDIAAPKGRTSRSKKKSSLAVAIGSERTVEPLDEYWQDQDDHETNAETRKLSKIRCRSTSSARYHSSRKSKISDAISYESDRDRIDKHSQNSEKSHLEQKPYSKQQENKKSRVNQKSHAVATESKTQRNPRSKHSDDDEIHESKPRHSGRRANKGSRTLKGAKETQNNYVADEDDPYLNETIVTRKSRNCTRKNYQRKPVQTENNQARRADFDMTGLPSSDENMQSGTELEMFNSKGDRHPHYAKNSEIGSKSVSKNSNPRMTQRKPPTRANCGKRLNGDERKSYFELDDTDLDPELEFQRRKKSKPHSEMSDDSSLEECSTELDDTDMDPTFVIQKGRPAHPTKPKTKQSKPSDNVVSHEWTDKELLQLTKAIQKLPNEDIRKSNFWGKVAKLVPTRTAAECRQCYQSAAQAVNRHNTTATKSVAKDVQNADKENIGKLAGAHTLKRKEQLRQIVDHANSNFSPEMTPENPVKKKRLPKDTAVTPLASVPMASPDSIRKSGAHDTGGTSSKIDRRKFDRYMRQVQLDQRGVVRHKGHRGASPKRMHLRRVKSIPSPELLEYESEEENSYCHAEDTFIWD